MKGGVTKNKAAGAKMNAERLLMTAMVMIAVGWVVFPAGEAAAQEKAVCPGLSEKPL